MIPRGLGRTCILLLIGLLAGCAATASRPAAPPAVTYPAGAPLARVPSFKHIFEIVLENKEYDSVIGNWRAPYLNSLAQQYGLATNYYAIAHPSLPNYLALTGGSAFGIATDCTDCRVSQPSLVDQLEAAGKSWKAYMEDMPGPCFVGDSAPLYRQKHNPFIYYDRVRNDPARCNKIVPFTQFAGDLKAGALPNYVWITPNMENDAHDGSLADADAWLKTWAPQILASPAWRDDGALFVTFDEGRKDGNTPGGRVVTLVISPLSKPGYQSPVPYTHYSLLRTIEDAWELPALGQASGAAPMADFFAGGSAAAR
jgi:phosphatidylinositol-3-phosphatase